MLAHLQVSSMHALQLFLDACLGIVPASVCVHGYWRPAIISYSMQDVAKTITKWNVKTLIHSLSICNLATLPMYILHSMWHPKAMEPWGYTQGLPWSTHNQRLQSWGYAPHSTRRRPPEGSSLQTHWYQIHTKIGLNSFHTEHTKKCMTILCNIPCLLSFQRHTLGLVTTTEWSS